MAEILNDPIRIPPGVREALLRIEEDGWSTLARITQRIDRGNPITPLLELRDELEREFSESEYSAFNRALQMPPVLLANDAPPMRAVSEGVSSLVRRTDIALALQEKVDQARSELDRGLDRGAAELPVTVNALLRDARLSDADFANIKYSADIVQLRNRIAWFFHQLDPIRFALEARRGSTRGLDVPEEWASPEASTNELHAILASRLAARRRLVGIVNPLIPVRQTLAQQHRELVHVAGRALAGRGSAIQLATELAGQVAARPRAIGHHYEDAGLWQAAIGEAWEHHEQAIRRPNWKPAITRESDSRGSAQLPRCVIPLGEGWVALTRSVRTPFVIPEEEALQAGKQVRVRIDWPLDWIDPVVARQDAEGLWIGLDAEKSAWYQAADAPTLHLIGTSESVWFARVASVGTLETGSAKAWNPDPGGSGQFRVLHRPEDQTTGIVACSDETSEPTFVLGCRTAIVRTALAGYDAALMRTVEPATAERLETLHAECSLFAALERNRAPSLHYLGQGESCRGNFRGFLYGMPVATRYADSQRLRQWMTKDIGARFAFVKAVSDVMAAVLRSGFSVGLYHLDLIGFGVRAIAGRQLVPSAMLLNAPLATRLGEPYRVRLPARELLRLRYSSLAFVGLADVIQTGVIASEWTERVAFTLFALDALAVRPIDGEATTNEWADLPSRIQTAAEVTYPGWGSSAQNVSAAMVISEPNRTLEEFFRMIYK